ncbi:MAG: WD40 repeat domain-containing protein, partial [Solirubrobacterales bacterium]
DHATDHNKRLIPVHHRAVKDGALPEAVGARNWVPAQGTFEDDFDGSLKSLLTAIEVDSERLHAHTRWEGRANEWADRDRPASLLARGSELREAEAWLASETGSEPAPTQLQAEFIGASRRGQSRRQRLALGAALLALVLTAAFAVYAVAQRGQAIDQRDLARSNDLAASSLSNLDTDPQLSLILAVAAAKAAETDRSEQALAQAVAASRERVEVKPGADLYEARVSPNGKWLVTASTEGANLYNARSGESLKTLQSGSAVYDLAFSDSSAVFTGGQDGVLRSFSLPDGKPAGKYDADQQAYSIALSADDSMLAMATPNGTITLFSGGSSPETLEGHTDAVRTVAFAASGSSLVSASKDGTAVVWDASSGTVRATLGREGDPAMVDADISADGQTVVTVGDGVAREWDVRSQRQIGQPLNDVFREGYASSVALSPDGKTALLALQDGSATAYDLATQTPVAFYRGHTGRVLSAEFGAGAHDVVTTGVDGTARVWDQGPVVGTLPGSETALTSSFSADGDRIAAGLSNGDVAIYDTSSGRLVDSFKASREALRAASFSADGARLVTAGDDGVTRVWNVDTHARIGPPLRQTDLISTAVFDRGATHVLTSSDDGTARLWNLADDTDVAFFRSNPHLDHPYSAEYSPDWKKIVVGEAGRYDAKVFDAATLDPLETLEQQNYISDASFDPSSARVATGGTSGIATIWNADTGDEILRLPTQHAQVQSVAWSPNGGQVITASTEGVSVWDADSGLELATIGGPAYNAAVSPAGLVTRTASSSVPVEVLECEVCTASDSELLSLAESRITREPTADEKSLYGLD